MALDFEETTPDKIFNRAAVDVQLAAPKSNPTRKNSFLYALVKSFCLRIYDFYLQLRALKKECFPNTSSIDGQLATWASYKKIFQNDASTASGVVTFTGVLNTEIPSGTQLSVSNNTYQTTNDSQISNNEFDAISAIRDGKIVTIKTNVAPNFSNSLSVTISGATQEIFNGLFPVSMVDATTFTYNVAGDDETETATGTIKVTAQCAYAVVNSINTGSETNEKNGVKLSVVTSIAGVDDTAVVTYSEISGGTDKETEESYRDRVLYAYANPVANFNPAAIIIHLRQNVPSLTRIWVHPITPAAGQVTIFFVEDNAATIPSQSTIDAARAELKKIVPVETAMPNVLTPTLKAKPVDFNFTSLTPNTITMRDAISKRIREMFLIDVQQGKKLYAKTYRAAITQTVSIIGETVESYQLSAPIADIDIDFDEIATEGTIRFSNNDTVYIDDLFDGNDGRSNGATNGFGKEISGENVTIDIFVFGSFGTATAALQKYDNNSSAWVDIPNITWSSPYRFTGLKILGIDKYRVNITNVNASSLIRGKVFLS